jgi:hypothetical protein
MVVKRQYIKEGTTAGIHNPLPRLEKQTCPAVFNYILFQV